MAQKVKDEYIWLIYYVDSEQVKNLEKDLKKNKSYKDIESYIPMVKVLNKQFKGKLMFIEVPLLFNYGFFRIKLSNAHNKEYLSKMREDIGCIYAWVKDEPGRGKESSLYGICIAIARDEEIKRIKESQRNFSIYSSEDLSKVKVGDIINLKGYPFDNIDAEILSIDFNKEKVKVSLQLDSIMKETTVSFENVFYSIYQGGYDENPVKEKSLDEMKEKNNGTYDKFMNTLCN